MTNQPDESHPVRDRVDDAISWFTQTDEPPEPEVAPVTEASAHEADVAPVAETAIPDTAPDQPLVPVEPVPAEVPTEPLPAEVPTAPLPAEVPDEPRPTEVPAEPTPASAPAERALDQSEDFMPADAAQETSVEPEPALDAEPVVAAPVAEQVESSAVDEPTRIHPIEPPSSWAEVHPDAKGIPEDAIDSEAETTAARRSLFRDEAPTVALPFGAAAAAGAATVEPTPVVDAQEAARVRREERAARDRQLGKVIAAPDDSDEPLVTRFATPSTYKGLPSIGLLVFRVVIAAVVGIRAWQHITHLSATREMWAATIVPSPGVFAWTQIGLEIAIAVMLLIGLGSRIAGLALTVLSVALLLFVQWGAVSPFQPGASDFIGVVDVLLAGAGLLYATVGGGRLAFDGALHAGRIRRKNDKLYS